MKSTKLQILIRRKAVRDLLLVSARRRLVVVSSPSGYGKTTVARQFAEREKRRTFFFTMPADSNDADSLWDMLWREMHAQGMENAAVLRRSGFPRNLLQIGQAVRTLHAMRPAVIILDDYQNRCDRAMDAFVEAAARGGTGSCRFLILSRTIPDMNLTELRRKGMAEVFERELLSFSMEEAREFFLLNGVVDGSAAARAWRYSEGWPAAMWLCLRGGRENGETPPAGDIESLLDRVVFSAYSRAEQTLLMQLSVLDSFTAGEAAALTLDRGARQRIARIRNKNAFLTCDPASRRYQFHSIFKSFLQKRLAAAPDLDTPDLYRRAAECRALRRDYMSAYRLLDRAGCDDDKSRILELLAEQGGEIIFGCQWEEIHAIVAAIPWTVRLKRPLGYLSFIWLHIYMDGGNFDAGLLDEAAKRFASAKAIPPELKKRLAGEMEYMRGVLAFNDYEEVAKHYLRAHELLSGPSILIYDRASWSISSPSAIFITHNKPGRLHIPKDIIDRHWRVFQTLTGGAGVGAHLVIGAEYHLERGEFDSAERMLTDLEGLVDGTKNITSFLLMSFSRARLLMARGRGEEALTLLRDLAPHIERTDMFEQIVCHDLALGYVSASLGRTDGLPRWLADGDVCDPPYAMPHIQAFILTVYGKILLARNDYAGLARLLEQFPHGFGPFEMPFGDIHASIFAAILARRRRDSEAALKSLAAALELSRPDGIVLPYAEYGDRILSLLRSLARTAPDDAHLAAVIELCKRTRPVRTSAGEADYKRAVLTARERKVLRLVARGKTTQAIANALSVSPSTVKKILSQACARLGAGGRAEAVSRFETMYGRKKADAAPPEAADGAAEPDAAVPEPEVVSRLVNSLLAAYSRDEAHSLMRLSVMEDFTVTEAAALNEDAAVAELLNKACISHGHLIHDAATGRYRFKPVVREHLENELAASPFIDADAELPALYRTAGECLVKRGEPAGALRLFLRAGRDADRVRGLDLFLMPGAEEMRDALGGELHDAVAKLPWRIRMAHPVGHLAFLWQSAAAGVDAKVVRRRLDEAESRFAREKTLSAAMKRRLRGEAAVVRGRIRFEEASCGWTSTRRPRPVWAARRCCSRRNGHGTSAARISRFSASGRPAVSPP